MFFLRPNFHSMKFLLMAVIATAWLVLPVSGGSIFVLTNSDVTGVSSFNTGVNWTNGAAPIAGNSYQTAAFILRTPANSSPVAFAGDSLEIQNGGNLRIKTSAATVTVGNLILDNGGIIDLSASPTTLAGNLNLAGGSAFISCGSPDVLTLSSSISGPGGFSTFNAVSSGAGTDILTSANTFSGGVFITGPAGTTLRLGNANAVSNSIVTNGVVNGLTFSPGIGTFNVGALAGSSNETLVDTSAAAVTLSAGGNNASTTFSGVLSGSGSLTKAGLGVLTLSSANSFSGGVTVAGGTLQANATGGGSAPLGTGTITVNAGATLVGTGGDAFGYSPNVAPLTFFINGGTITDLGTSSYRITMPNITFKGGTLTSAPGNNGDTGGNYSLFGTGVPTVVTTLSNNTTAIINAAKISLQQNNQQTGLTTFNVAAGNVTGGTTPGVDLWVATPLVNWNGSTSSLLKSGTGVMAFTGANSYSGGTTISGGTMQLGTPVDAGALTQLFGTGLVTNNATINFASSQSVTVGNVVSGTGVITVTRGTGILTGANTYSGGTTVSGGTLLVNNTTGSGTGTSNVTVNSTGTLGGTGTIGGNVIVNGTTFPAVAAGGATNTITGNLAYNSGASANFHLNFNGAGTGNDQIVLNGASSVLNCGNVNVGILMTATSLDQVNDYVLFSLGGPSSSIVGNFNPTPVWLGTVPANSSSYSIVNLASKVILHFNASGTTNVPTLFNLGATGIGFTNAILNGHLTSTGGQFPTVRIYYGTNNAGTNAAAWANNISLGLQTGTFNGTVSNLTANTTYFFNSSASNSAGTGWASSPLTFTTLALVLGSVTNLPPSNVQGTSAVLNGQVLSTGNQVPNVTLYYGTNNGGTNAGAWANNIFLGQQSGAFAATVTGLTTNTTYYFAAGAANNAGIAWGQPSLAFTTLPTAPVASVLTYHNDNARTGQNTNETLLTPATLNTNNFGLLIKYVVDGYVFAQPLYVANVAIPGQGTHNVLYVATEHNTVYAFDADNNAGANGGLLWKTNLGIAPLSSNGEFGGRYHNGVYIDLTPEVGITGTPVIDPVTGTLYMDVLTREVTGTTNYIHRIHALDITTGVEKTSPVVVTASVPGAGVGGNGSVVTFDAKMQGQRPALTLAGGKLYVAYGSFADTDPYHGWVLGFDPTTLKQLTNYIFNSTPNATTGVFGGNAGEGALWMGGNGLCVDSNNNLYFETANGSFSANTGGGDYADSFVKLSTTNSLSVADYFSPSNQASLASADSDLGSGGPILLPDEVGSLAHPHLIAGGGKAGKIFLVDRDNMGHFNSNTNLIVEEFNSNAGSFFGSPAYFNFQIYYRARAV